jgi:hypothetical protein
MALSHDEHVEHANAALARLKHLNPHSTYYGNTAAEGALHALLALLTPPEVNLEVTIETPKQQVARAVAEKRAARTPKAAAPGHPLADAVEKLTNDAVAS